MKSALIIVDVQNDFLPGGALGVKQGDEVIPLINELIQKPFDTIVATGDWHPEHHVSFASTHNKQPGDTISIHGISQILWPDHCLQNTPGAAFTPEWDTTRIDKVFHKGTDPDIDSYSTFFDNERQKETGLHTYLHGKGITHVYLVGLTTEYCVKYSALDALSLGYQVFVFPEACRPVNLHPHDEAEALTEMEEAGIQLIGVAGFEPTTSSSRTKRASQPALHPEKGPIKKNTLLSVKVTPKARAPGITGWHEHVLQVKVSAPPDKGKANEEVIALLSDYFHIPKSHIELLRGHTSPHKHFKLTGVTDTTLFPF